MKVGTRVRTKRAYVSVPQGTEGVVDELYSGGVMVAWDLPEYPLPPEYRKHNGRPSFGLRLLRDGFGNDEPDLLRDGFGNDELDNLEEVGQTSETPTTEKFRVFRLENQ